MTSHELARQLLAGPDALVVLSVGNPEDTFVSDTEDRLRVTVDLEDENAMVSRGFDEHPERQIVTISGWQSSEEPEDD